MATFVKHDFGSYFEGDTFNAYDITINEDGSPVDLTGATVEFYARFNHPDTGAVSINKSTSAGGVTLTDADAGELQIDEFDLSSMSVGTHYCFLRVTFSSGEIRTYIKGRMDILNSAIV